MRAITGGKNNFEQEGSAYIGHFGCTCFHPVFCFNQFEDCKRVLFRSGNAHIADRWKEVLEPIVKRYENRKYFRVDAALSKPDILGNFLRRLVLPKKMKHWSLRSLFVKFIKTGAKIVRHRRYVTLQVAEVAIDKRLFAKILFRIERLRS